MRETEISEHFDWILVSSILYAAYAITCDHMTNPFRILFTLKYRPSRTHMNDGLLQVSSTFEADFLSECKLQGGFHLKPGCS